MRQEEPSILTIAEKRLAELTRSEHEAREKAAVVRSELQSETTWLSWASPEVRS